jgi:ABC-type methionine transport system permease subunit
VAEVDPAATWRIPVGGVGFVAIPSGAHGLGQSVAGERLVVFLVVVAYAGSLGARLVHASGWRRRLAVVGFWVGGCD